MRHRGTTLYRTRYTLDIRSCNADVGVSLAQRGLTRVRNLIAACEIKRGELGAPLRQRDHTRVREQFREDEDISRVFFVACASRRKSQSRSAFGSGYPGSQFGVLSCRIKKIRITGMINKIYILIRELYSTVLY